VTRQMKRFPWLLACTAVLLTAPSAQAQTVSDVVGFLMTNQAVPTSSFERDRASAESARDTIIQALQVNLASTPLATSSSGFLYRFNPQLGTAERASETFGGFFVERALTAGAGRLSLGFSTASASFDQLDGHDLRDGSFVTIANQFRDEASPFEEELLTLRIRSVTTTFNASVGVNSRLELGAAVPVMRLTLDGTRVYIHRGVTSAQAAGSSTASGFGDVALRAKYQLVAAPKGGLSVATEVRLPTGDEKNLLGAGAAALRVSAVGSLERGITALNFNGGFLQGGVSDEWTGAAGLAVAAAPRVTLVGEVLARYLSDLKEISLTSTPHPEIAGADTLRLSAGPAGRALVDTLAGVKWNVASRLVFEAHARWAVRHYGLTSSVVPTIGFEYAF
jgi:Putative MetA-pathway of phenol degradation